MKKVLTLLMVASIFSLVACGGPTPEEQAKAEEDAKAMVEDMFSGMEEADATTEEEVAEVELAEHVCNDQCTAEGECSFKCGEKGHVCSDACHAAEEGTTTEEVPVEEAPTE